MLPVHPGWESMGYCMRAFVNDLPAFGWRLARSVSDPDFAGPGLGGLESLGLAGPALGFPCGFSGSGEIACFGELDANFCEIVPPSLGFGELFALEQFLCFLIVASGLFRGGAGAGQVLRASQVGGAAQSLVALHLGVEPLDSIGLRTGGTIARDHAV